MESNIENQKQATEHFVSGACPVCHQPIFSQYYFCPNCGTKLNAAPLRTDAMAQLKLYAFSIILPCLGFLFVTKWQGAKYYKSNDPKAKQIGQVAWTLLILSTIIVIWLAIRWAQSYVQSTVNDLNTDLGSLQ